VSNSVAKIKQRRKADDQSAITFAAVKCRAMPVVSMPIPISGRNMLWRRIVIDAICSDPQTPLSGFRVSNQSKSLWSGQLPLHRFKVTATDFAELSQWVIPSYGSRAYFFG
jgi:hypothetical protein